MTGEPVVPAGTVDNAAASSPRSLVEQIRRRHERKDPHLDLAVPRFGGDVVVRYGRTTTKALQASTRNKAPKVANAALLASACREVFIVDDDGALHPASEADGLAAPIRFDGRLADLFELGGESPAGIVLAMYADDVAVAAHAKRVWDWQTGAELDVASSEEVDDLAGEADAAT